MTKRETRDLAEAVGQTNKKQYSKRLIAKAFNISRTSLYYKPVLPSKDKSIVNQINEQYETDDTLGCRKLAKLLGTTKNRMFRIMLKYGIKPRRKRPKYYYHGKKNME